MYENVKSGDIAHYFDVGTSETPAITLGIVMTDLSENSNPTETEKQYYLDKSKTTTVTGFANEFAITSDLVKNDVVSMYFYNIFRDRKMGSDAQTIHYYVDLYAPVTGSENTYNARKSVESVVIGSATQTPGEDITFDGSLKGVGDMINGTFNTETKTFTPESE